MCDKKKLTIPMPSKRTHKFISKYLKMYIKLIQINNFLQLYSVHSKVNKKKNE